MKTTKKILLSVSFFLFYKVPCFAQNSGISAQIEEWETEFRVILYSAAAIIALYGAFGVYQKFSSNDDHAPKALINWLKGLGVIALASLIVEFFLESIT